MRFYDLAGDLTFHWDETASVFRVETASRFNAPSTSGQLQIDQLNDGVIFQVGDALNNFDTRIKINADDAASNPGDINFRAQNGTTIVYQWDQSQGRHEFSDGSAVLALAIASGQLLANDGSTGEVEIFPKAYIDIGNVGSTTDILNVAASWTTLAATTQTVACEYASQPVAIALTIRAKWINTSSTGSYGVRPVISGATPVTNATTDGPRTTDTDASTGGNNVDIDGSTGTQSASHDHNVNSGNTATTSSHLHGPGTLNTGTQSAGHSHASGTLAVNGTHTHSHSHAVDFENGVSEVTVFYETTANGSGNLVFSMQGSGDATADITAWHMSWRIERR
jgi:hypothetical protein